MTARFIDRHNAGLQQTTDQGWTYLSIADESGFSQYPCGLCDALPGDRHELVGVHKDTPKITELACEVCTDCALFMANGDLPDEEDEP